MNREFRKVPDQTHQETCSVNNNSVSRKEHSTQHALITPVDNIIKALDEGSIC